MFAEKLLYIAELLHALCDVQIKYSMSYFHISLLVILYIVCRSIVHAWSHPVDTKPDFTEIRILIIKKLLAVRVRCIPV